MDQAVLVKDRDIGAKVMEALNRANIPASFVDWTYVPELEEWQLIIASPWFDSKGPLTTNRALVDAFQKANIYEDVPMRRVFLRSPSDPLVKRAERKAKVNNEGFLHILRHEARNTPTYSVVFAPTAGPGGAVPARRISSLDELKIFLTEDLGLRLSAVDEALDELKRKGASSIFPVSLTTRQMKKHGFY
jgi:hypothetical protein